MSSTPDYYDQLNVARDASADDIRRAYRKLARELHPDVNKAPDAAERFAQVQEAYEVLSDAEKRRNYDRFGHTGVGAGAGTGGPFRGGGYSVNVDPSDFGTIFEDFFGARGAPFDVGSGPRAARPAGRRGENRTQRVQVTFMTAARGGTEGVRVAGPNGVETIEVRIPAGVEPGAKLRIKGRGEPGLGGGDAGDLLLEIDVGDHPWLSRNGLDLLMDVPITIAEAAIGTEFTVPLLKGSVTVKSPPGVSSGRRIRIAEQGIADDRGNAGDFFVVIQIVAPETLDDGDRAALEALGQRLKNPRESAPWADGGGG